MSGRSLKFILLSALSGLMLAGPGVAQNLFAPVVRVNDSVVTEYEVQQRIRFLQILNAPGATRASVTEALIDDRLRAQAVRIAGLNLTQEGIDASMNEFASRADLSKDEFIAALADAGVSEETFRDFVVIGASWRELIRAQFGARVDISDAEIDRALSAAEGAGGIRVLVSEIIIPAPPEEAEAVLELAETIALSESEAEFSNFAREYSATASRDVGGQLPWQDLSALPPVLRPLLLSLSPGEVTDPLPIPNAVALFQLRDIQETSAPQPVFGAIEYAIYYIPGGRSQAALSEAARIAAQVDVCDDLYGIAQGQPEQQLQRETKAPGEIPQDIAIELSKLDPGEVSTTLTSADGQALAMIMLCGRTAQINQDISREDVAQTLRQQRLAGYADSLLSELRSEARIQRQ
jgi:peptidyl-prolyl cis-trans isomerase SurA